VADGWRWDETLYAGAATYYALGRLPYPSALGDVIAEELGVQGTEQAVDVGCGPGSLTLLLAPHVGRIVGVDADAEMIDQATRAAQRRGLLNVSWRRMRAEDLPPPGIEKVDVVTFAQSFHWMDRMRVARLVREMLAPGGSCIHVHATTHRGDSSDDPLPLPRPPYERIERLVGAYLGPVRRAGRSFLPAGTPDDEATVFRAAGFADPRRLDVRRGEVTERSVDQIIAATFSLSSSTPSLFGTRLSEFERDLRELLEGESEDGRFCERARDIALDVWQPVDS
jgi:SAM-dependent methyltransferase